jgi:hypothetical protein
MITDFTSMLAELKGQALLVANVTNSTHVGSGENMISRLHKFYEGTFMETTEMAIFIDTSEAFLEDDDSENIRLTFDVGLTVLKKELRSNLDGIDVVWGETVNALVEYIGRIKHLQHELEDDFEIIVSNKFAQVGKIVNADVYGWRADAKISFPANHIYCSHL